MLSVKRCLGAAAAVLILASSARADSVNLIGDWTQGFTSDYAFGNILDPGTLSWNNTHPYWQDAVGQPGAALYVNGLVSSTSKAYGQTFDAPADTTLQLDSWLANVCCTSASGLIYPAAILEWWINGSKLTSIQTDGAGVMQKFTASFWTGNGGPMTLELRNQSMCYDGCDFAMGETSVTSVPTPEPATIGLMLTGLGFAWRQRRRRQTA